MSAGFELLRSLTRSYDEAIEATIKGTIPEWLNGTLFRNGPGRFEYGDKSYKHVFDGQSCVHKFKIENGKVEYSNKLLETQSYQKSSKENRLYPVFGTADLASNIFGRLKTIFKIPDTFDNVNVNIQPFTQNHLYAMTETNLICRVNPKDLSIISTTNITDYIPSVTTSIAHPHIEPDGSWLVVGINIKRSPAHYDFIKYDASVKPVTITNICESGEIIASIPSSHKLGVSYFHSFGVTKNYIILLEQSLKLSFLSFVMGLIKNRAHSEALKMNPNWNTRIRIINKHTGEEVRQKFITDPLFTFHHINAYEKVDPLNSNKIEIVVDICAYDPHYFDINKFTYEYMFTEKLLGTDLIKAMAKRIIIPMDLTTDNTSKEIFCQLKYVNSRVSIELPTINYDKFNGKPYKYFYGANHFTKPFSVVKINVEDEEDMKEMKYKQDNNDFLPSEPIFVESPNAKNEDDGVVLVMVLSEPHDFLSILDAKDMKEIARAEIPEEVKGAHTFHGFFADKKKFRRLNV